MLWNVGRQDSVKWSDGTAIHHIVLALRHGEVNGEVAATTLSVTSSIIARHPHLLRVEKHKAHISEIADEVVPLLGPHYQRPDKMASIVNNLQKMGWPQPLLKWVDYVRAYRVEQRQHIAVVKAAAGCDDCLTDRELLEALACLRSRFKGVTITLVELQAIESWRRVRSR